MSNFIYELSPTFTLGLLALTFIFRIYSRSKSTFLIIIVSAIVVNLNHNGYQEYSSTVILLALALLLIRAMAKPANDYWVCKPYHGEEKRKIKRV